VVSENFARQTLVDREEAMRLVRQVLILVFAICGILGLAHLDTLHFVHRLNEASVRLLPIPGHRHGWMNEHSTQESSALKAPSRNNHRS